MSKETAKKLISELQTNEELKAKVQGVTDPAELTKIAVDAGYDVTMEELIEAEHEFRAETAKNTDKISGELSDDDLEAVAGGFLWKGDDASDGHEMGCWACYHGSDYKDERCQKEWYCLGFKYRYDS